MGHYPQHEANLGRSKLQCCTSPPSHDSRPCPSGGGLFRASLRSGRIVIATIESAVVAFALAGCGPGELSRSDAARIPSRSADIVTEQTTAIAVDRAMLDAGIQAKYWELRPSMFSYRQRVMLTNSGERYFLPSPSFGGDRNEAFEIQKENICPRRNFLAGCLVKAKAQLRDPKVTGITDVPGASNVKQVEFTCTATLMATDSWLPDLECGGVAILQRYDDGWRLVRVASLSVEERKVASERSMEKPSPSEIGSGGSSADSWSSNPVRSLGVAWRALNRALWTRPGLVMRGEDGSVFVADTATNSIANVLGPVNHRARFVTAAAFAPLVLYSEPPSEGDAWLVSDVYAIDLRDLARTRLSDDGKTRNAVPSPDGKTIVVEEFEADVDEAYACCGKGLYTLNADGSEKHAAVGIIPLGAADRDRWGFVAEDFWFEDEHLKWSSDSRGFAFSRRYGKEVPELLFWKELSGAGEPIRVVGSSSAEKTRATDVSTSSILLDDSEMAVYRHDFASGETHRIAAGACCARFSPDGSRVLMIDLDSEHAYASVSTAAVDGSNRRKTFVGSVSSATWDAEGDAILVTQWMRESGNKFSPSTWRIAANGSGAELLFRGMGEVDPVRVGRWLDLKESQAR